MVITTAQHHSTKPRLSFCTGSNLACGVLEICMVRISDNGPTQMEVRLINNTTKTIHHHHHHHHHHYCITKYLFFYKLVDFNVKYLWALGQIRMWTHPMATSYQVILLNLEQLKKLLAQTLFTRWIDPSLHQGKGQLGQKLCKLILLICSPTIFLKWCSIIGLGQSNVGQLFEKFFLRKGQLRPTLSQIYATFCPMICSLRMFLKCSRENSS